MTRAVNTVKALTEDRAKKVAELRDVHKQLETKPGDADLAKRFESIDGELKTIEESLQRAARVESLAAATLAAGTPDLTGVEDRDLTDGQKKDNPLYDPDGKGYRLLNVIDAQLNGRALKGIEGEVQSAMEERAAKHNRKARGMLLPMNLRCDLPAAKRFGGSAVETRDLTLSGGAGAIAAILSPTLIQMLRRRVVCVSLGATIMNDMVGNFAIPKETAEPTYAWVAEGAAAAESEGTIGQVTFSARTMSAWTTLTRRFIKQASIDAEMFARYQLVSGAARGLDFGCLSGPGTTNNVTGLTIAAGVPLVAMGTNGAALTWAKVVEFETKVAQGNADVETMAWVINAATQGSAKTLSKTTGLTTFLLENREMNGYPVAVTNALSSTLTKGASGAVCSAAVFGDFSKLVIALWGGLDILVDPYSESTNGNVRVNAFQDVDINRIYDEAFSRCVDIIA